MNVAFVTAMTFTTAANVIFLQYTAPLFIAVASPLFGERFEKENTLPLLVGLVGVSILMWGADLKDWGVWLALLSGVSSRGGQRACRSGFSERDQGRWPTHGGRCGARAAGLPLDGPASG